MLMSLIDASEGRDVVVIDIPNAFIQTRLKDEKDKVVMQMRGKLAELMVTVAPEIYCKHVSINKKGETVLYVHLLNALYGLMRASLLFYICFLENLLSIGFKLNPYDPCVANKQVRGTQMTICWHVDDIKLSHKQECCVTKMIDWLREQYENCSVMDPER